jgi:hypothetical protein
MASAEVLDEGQGPPEIAQAMGKKAVNGGVKTGHGAAQKCTTLAR